MPGALDRFIGGSPLAVLIRLVLLSLIVGFVLSRLGVSAGDILVWVQSQLSWVWRRGWNLLADFGNWILVGAVVVIPLWIVTRLASRR